MPGIIDLFCITLQVVNNGAATSLLTKTERYFDKPIDRSPELNCRYASACISDTLAQTEVA